MIFMSLFLAAVLATDCKIVSQDVIRMRDLAAVEPEFSKADPDTVVGYSPMPGAVHVMTGAQIKRLAKTYALADEEYQSACFQRAMRELNPDDLLEIMGRV